MNWEKILNATIVLEQYCEEASVDERYIDWLNDIKLEAKSNTSKSDFSKLQELLETDDWPMAADAKEVCDETDVNAKLERAAAILDFLLPTSIRDQKFLDFGCGQGHVVAEARKRNAKLAVGYDPKKQWGDSPGLYTDWDLIKKQGPYDLILVYDVLDHTNDVLANFQTLHEVSNKDTNIVIRMHPWCSRHGCHNYYGNNKAFAHVIFTEAELKEIDGTEKYASTSIITHPMIQYRKRIKLAGFRIISEDAVRQRVEGFFNNAIIKKRICAKYRSPLSKWHLVKEQLEQTSVDYILKIK